MEYKKFGDTYIIRMDRGEEIVQTLSDLCKKEDIRLASVDALGAVSHAVLSVYDMPAKVFCRKTFDEPMEISSLCGTVTQKDGEPYLHLHGTVCDTQHRAHGGHVNELIVSATCEMVVRTLPGEVGRRFDAEIGLNLFEF